MAKNTELIQWQLFLEPHSERPTFINFECVKFQRGGEAVPPFGPVVNTDFLAW